MSLQTRNVRTRLALLFVTALLFMSPSDARAQPIDPVGVEAEGVFGDALVSQNRGSALSIRLTNRRQADLRGELVVYSGWSENRREFRQRLDLPGGQTRSALVDIIGQNSSITVEFVAGGDKLGRATVNMTHRGLPSSVVVLADPSTLRGELLDMDVEIDSVRTTVDIGAVTDHPTTGDPILPRSPSGWGSVGLLVTTPRALSRVRGVERAALRSWIQTGGRMLIFPRAPSELASESLSDFVPPFVTSPETGSRGYPLFLPGGSPLIELSGASVTPEPFGGVARLGFGSVYLATWDGTAPPLVSAPQTRALIRSIVATPKHQGQDTPQVASFDQDTQFSGSAFDDVRRALDPNESFRPALVAVAFVLFFYVLLVGPINFSLIEKRNQPMLALLTTPLIAAACIIGLLVVGYVGKGVTMRYRAVQVDEYVAGETRGTSVRYLGLFTTRPTSFAMEVPRFGDVRTRYSASPPIAAGTERRSAGPIVGGLWDTLFVRRVSESELSGSIRFSDDGQSEVINDSSIDLRGAIVVRGRSVSPVGAIPANSRREVGPVSPTAWTPVQMHVSAPGVSRLQEMLNAEEVELELLVGAMRLMPRQSDYVLAWYVTEEPREADLYRPERVLRFIRIASRATEPLVHHAEASP